MTAAPPVGGEGDELEALGHHRPGAVDDLGGQRDDQRGSVPGSVGSNSSVPASRARRCVVDGDVEDGVHEWVSGGEQFGAAGVVGIDTVGVEGGPLVPGGDRDRRAGTLPQPNVAGTLVIS